MRKQSFDPRTWTEVTNWVDLTYRDYTGFTAKTSADLFPDPNFLQPLKLPLGDGFFTVQKCEPCAAFAVKNRACYLV